MFILGMLFLVISYFGIIMPGIPAIPFIILSGYFFLNSSETLYNWMLRQRILGTVLRKFNREEGVSQKAIWFVISQLWVSLIIAQILFSMNIYVQIALNLAGLVGSLLIYYLLKSSNKSESYHERKRT